MPPGASDDPGAPVTALAERPTTEAVVALQSALSQVELESRRRARAFTWGIGAVAALIVPLLWVQPAVGGSLLLLTLAAATWHRWRPPRAGSPALREAYQRGSRLVDHAALPPAEQERLNALLDQARPHLE